MTLIPWLPSYNLGLPRYNVTIIIPLHLFLKTIYQVSFYLFK